MGLFCRALVSQFNKCLGAVLKSCRQTEKVLAFTFVFTHTDQLHIEHRPLAAPFHPPQLWATLGDPAVLWPPSLSATKGSDSGLGV